MMVGIATMENDYIGLFTVNQSGQVKAVLGGLGDDQITSLIMADSFLPDPLASGNSHEITGDEGVDYLDASVSAVASFGGSATSIDNTTSASGGAKWDFLNSDLAALASAGGSAMVSGNSALLQGDDGDDYLGGRIMANAMESSDAVATDNLLTLEGGDGSDFLSVCLRLSQTRPAPRR